jgi:hypothetical protein
LVLICRGHQGRDMQLLPQNGKSEKWSQESRIQAISAGSSSSVSVRATSSVKQFMVVMDCTHERRISRGSSSSRSRGDCAGGRFVPIERVGAQCVLPPSWHGIEHTESSPEETAA